MSWYLTVVKKYAQFAGRARRKEYWMYVLFYMIFMVVATLVDNLLGLTFKVQGVSMGYGFIFMLFALVSIIPTISVTVRRLHDQDKSGAWFFIGLVPFIGGIWLLVLLLTAGTAGANQYGPDPKALS